MQAFILLCLAAAAVAMPYGPVLEPAWGGGHVAYAQPVVKQIVQPQYVHAAPVVKAVAPAASSYATFSQVHVSHPQPIVKQVIAQPVVKQVVAQPVYQPVVKHVVSQPVYAQPLVQKVVAQPVYSHNPW